MKRQIDLAGPEGNGMAFIGIARNYAKQLDKDAKAITAEMMSGDYKNLCAVFEREFGDYAELIQVEEDEDA